MTSQSGQWRRRARRAARPLGYTLHELHGYDDCAPVDECTAQRLEAVYRTMPGIPIDPDLRLSVADWRRLADLLHTPEWRREMEP